MRAFIMFFVVGSVLCGANQPAKAEIHEEVSHEESRPHLALAATSEFIGGFSLHRELVLDVVLVASLPVGRNFELYVELGLGTAFAEAEEQIFTLPLGGGVMYELTNNFALGFAVSYSSRFGEFFEGSILAGPFLEVTLSEHTGPFGSISIVAIPGFAAQFLPGHPSGLGAGLSLGAECSFE